MDPALGVDELLLSRVVAFRPSHRMRDFLYIETTPDQPSGAYRYAEGELDTRLAERRESGVGHHIDEEYDLWNGRPITRNRV